MKRKILCLAAIVIFIGAAVLSCIIKAQRNTEPEPSISTLAQKIICIDPGHGKTSRREKEYVHPKGGEKKAANVSGASGQLMSEEALNLEVGLKLKAALEEKGAVVYITRQVHESDMSNIERAEFANEKNCDMVVRIHADGSENKSVSGASILVPSSKSVYEGYLSEEIVQKSRRCAELVLSEVCLKTGAQNRGVVERSDMTGFNWSSVPVVLLEMGFMSNAAEEQKLVSTEYQGLIVSGITTALEKYFIE